MNDPIPTPGSLFPGPFPYIACAVLNDEAARVNIPEVIIRRVQEATGVVELLWPLGVYVAFTADSMNVGAFGYDKNKKIVHGISTIPFSEDERPAMGDEVWGLWRRYKMPPYSLTFVTIGNFQRLRNETRAIHKFVETSELS